MVRNPHYLIYCEDEGGQYQAYRISGNKICAAKKFKEVEDTGLLDGKKIAFVELVQSKDHCDFVLKKHLYPHNGKRFVAMC